MSAQPNSSDLEKRLEAIEACLEAMAHHLNEVNYHLEAARQGFRERPKERKAPDSQIRSQDHNF